MMERDNGAASELATVAPHGDEPEIASLSLRAVAAVNIEVNNLSLQIDVSPNAFSACKASLMGSKGQHDQQYKSIVDGVSASMPSGSLTAILGGSGSGKTSLLNSMSHRMKDRRLSTSGTVLYNGNPKLTSVCSAYVMQQDVLPPTLTVRETLLYAAELRLPPPTTSKERHRIVEDVILELGLKECANTRIGNSFHKGCSGGEKRRTSLGVQMLANPSILFLDEVTTGLDATSAFQLIRTLKMLAGKGRTIIVTIHQPRSEIWGLFDRLLLLTGGSPIYSGSVAECLPYFQDLGYPLPPFVNPAEHLIDLAAVDTCSIELEAASSIRVESLKRAWRTISNKQISQPEKSSDAQEAKHSTTLNNRRSMLTRQVRVLTARTWKVTIRDPMGVAASLIEATSMGVIMGWIFLSLDGSLSGLRSREGALYSAASLQSYLILLFEVYRLTLDIELFDREYGEGVVGVLSFLISRRLARVFIEDIPVPFIFSIIFYFMAGFRAVASQFFIFFLITLLCHYIAVSFAMVCVAASRNFAGASLIANMGYTIQSFGCGYFVQSNQMPVYMRWLKWTAYVFYAFGGLAANEFVGHTSDPQGHLYDCPAGGGMTNPACKQYTGQYVMESLGFPLDWITRPITILAAFVVAFSLGASLILKFWKVEMGISRAQKTDIDYSTGKENMTARSLDEVRTVHLQLDEYTLNIRKRNRLWWKASADISILKPITAQFQPGVLNIVMGPSGSGKTSLLNLMARRLHNSMNTQYEVSGRMLFNGANPSDVVVRSICAYVCQDDDSLLPYLTVRENLHFAASLRLPTHLSKQEKISRAESIILKMGLRDCADNLVGSNLVKGISGGEKRRVTIATQILTEPRVLLLDEPTSGLDAFTASSIINVLKGLAEEGRTLILTIHQSRSDLFKQFGSILLLARGGSTVYAGKASLMLPHFASLGFHCPSATNPADFALDVITVDLQHSLKEAASRQTVRSLIVEWENCRSIVARVTSHIDTPAELGSLIRAMTPFHIAFPLLLRRSFINFRRNPPSIVARTTQVLGFAIIMTLFYAPLKSDYYSVQSRLGFIAQFAAIYFVGMLQNVAVYPNEKRVFYHEHDDNAYSIEAFFLQYTLAELPFEIFTSLLFALLAVFATGLPRTATVFFLAAFNVFAIVSCGESVGIAFNTLVGHTGFAISLTSVLMSVATVMGGVMSLDIPAFLQAWNNLSPIKWSVRSLAAYSLRGVSFSCTDQQRLENGRCPIETGEQVLSLYRLTNDAKLSVLALGLCVVAYRALAYGILKAKRTRWRRLKGRFGRRESHSQD